MAAAGHEAFIGWKGETYLPPPAVPAAAMAAEPLQRGAGADAGTYTAQATAVVDQVRLCRQDWHLFAGVLHGPGCDQHMAVLQLLDMS
jgi:hypothetical protein